MENKTKDSKGFSPDFNLIGTSWRHYKTQYAYQITDFAFLGDTDEWILLYRRNGCEVLFSRTVDNFFGKIDDNTLRFTKV